MKHSSSRVNWDILYRKLSGEQSEEITRLWDSSVQQWPEYEEIYLELLPYFQQADHAEVLDVYGTLNKFRNIHLPSSRNSTAPSLLWQIGSRRIWMAAVFTGILLLAAWWGTHYAPVKKTPLAWKEAVSAPGKTLNLKFSDGTTVRLAPGSRLRYPLSFQEGERKVVLEGKAFFHVATDSVHPFYVHSGPVITKVTGTSFEINTDSLQGKYVVSLLEGAVELLEHTSGSSAPVPLTRLRPGQCFTLEEHREEWKVFSFSAGEAAALRRGGLVFRNEPLENIAAVLETQFNVKTIFSNRSLASICFTAVFQRLSLNEILHVLEAGGKLRIQRNQETIVFSPKK